MDWLCRQLGQLALRMLSVSALHYFYPNENETLRIAPEWEETNHPQGHQLVAQALLTKDPEAARQSMILHVMGDRFAERRRQVFHL